jgi:hypothetical protein
MRLLNARTITLENFTSENVAPPYAILSHTWGLEEVTLDDLEQENPSRLHGYWKIETACQETCRAGIGYLWVDTCCIDKRSSSELSEAINSMFKWYRSAFVCFAYLHDVEASDYELCQRISTNLDLTSDQEEKIRQTQFAKSRWWRRGWTLQELIAPDELVFYDRAFRRIGSKQDLVRVVSLVSSIDENILLNKISMKDVCVATKMSWAAERKTTRIEDVAYSLLGIFDINMAMLYGEGDRAFVRLQEEIIKSTNDQSIFAWSGFKFENGSLFAPRPSCFKIKHRIIPVQHWNNTTEFTLTNAGLDIPLSLWSSSENPRQDIAGNHLRHRRWIAPLACRYEMNFSGRIALELEETEETGTFVLHPKSERLLVFNTGAESDSSVKKSILIRQEPSVSRIKASNFVFNKKCVVRYKDHPNHFRNQHCYPPGSWNLDRDVFWLKRSTIITGALHLLTRDGWDLILMIGYIRENNDTTVTSWGQEWIALEKFAAGAALEAHCESYQGVEHYSEKRPKVQHLNLPGICRVQANISSCKILEEEVFLVEVSVNERN